MTFIRKKKLTEDQKGGNILVLHSKSKNTQLSAANDNSIQLNSEMVVTKPN